MPKIYWLFFSVAATAAAAGCSSRGVYEGIQQQEAVKNPSPAGQPAARRPTYDEYETERRKANSTDGR